jgi:hypothetical protein
LAISFCETFSKHGFSSKISVGNLIFYKKKYANVGLAFKYVLAVSFYETIFGT